MSLQTKAMATEAVEHLQEHLRKEFPKEAVDVHWDDCDMEERKFWVHVRAKSLREESPDPKLCTYMGYAIRTGIKLLKVKQDQHQEFQTYWDKQTAPVPRYRKLDGRNRFHEYSTDTWIYVLTIRG